MSRVSVGSHNPLRYSFTTRCACVAPITIATKLVLHKAYQVPCEPPDQFGRLQLRHHSIELREL